MSDDALCDNIPVCCRHKVQEKVVYASNMKYRCGDGKAR